MNTITYLNIKYLSVNSPTVPIKLDSLKGRAQSNVIFSGSCHCIIKCHRNSKLQWRKKGCAEWSKRSHQSCGRAHGEAKFNSKSWIAIITDSISEKWHEKSSLPGKPRFFPPQRGPVPLFKKLAIRKPPKGKTSLWENRGRKQPILAGCHSRTPLVTAAVGSQRTLFPSRSFPLFFVSRKSLILLRFLVHTPMWI